MEDVSSIFFIIFIVFLVGFLLGVGLSILIYYILSKKGKERFDLSIGEATGSLKESFSDISLNSLSKTTDHLIKIASEKLSSERELSVKEIASQKQALENKIETLNSELLKLTNLVNTLENKRSSQIGELKQALDTSHNQTMQLYSVTNNLNQTLSSKQHRGQWGERMADDILNSCGLKEGINYLRQSKSASGNRPDFTFLFPNNMKLNMDVKFPFENYRRYIDADDIDKGQYKQAFIKDVKNHIKAVSGREYINIEEKTLDCVLLFIPNESIYSFIFQVENTIIDEASTKNVLICSPSSLISILSVMRQAADNFVIEKNAKLLLQALSVFRKEWGKYSDSLDKIGGFIDKLSNEYRELMVTRTKKLDKSINELELLSENNEIYLEEK